MAPTAHREQRFVFDEVAEIYDRVRPGYPELLVEDLLARSELPANGRILEVGCGTGQATLALARRGYRMLCLEPGRNLSALAAKHCAPYPKVEVQSVTFEEWPIESTAFDLVLSAQAFHWVDPTVRFTKAAETLVPGGALAIVGNKPEMRDSELEREIQGAYAKYAPGLAAAARLPGTGTSPQGLGPEEGIDDSGLFGPVSVSRFPWCRDYSAQDYAALMETQSDHRLLPESQRTALQSAIRTAIERSGGSRRVEYVAWLTLARRSPVLRRD